MGTEQSLTKHAHLTRVLRESILSGSLVSADGRLPSEAEIAETHHVSRNTVRQAVAALQAEGLVVRRQGSGTYARRSGEMPVNGLWIAIVTCDPGGDGTRLMVEGIDSGLAPEGLSVRVYPATDDPSDVDIRIEQALADGADGIIAYPACDSTYSPVIHRMKRLGPPCVLMDRYLSSVPTACAMSDGVEAGFLVGEHLAALGHLSVAFVSMASTTTITVAERLAGLEAAAKALGRPAPGVLTESDPAALLARLKGLLRGDGRPTAVFAVNDAVASTVLRAAADLGLGVPQDLSIVGFDNSSMAQHLPTPLTTIDPGLTLIGRQAARLMVEARSGAASSVVRVPPRLVVRHSTGPVSPGGLTERPEERGMVV